LKANESTTEVSEALSTESLQCHVLLLRAYLLAVQRLPAQNQTQKDNSISYNTISGEFGDKHSLKLHLLLGVLHSSILQRNMQPLRTLKLISACPKYK